MLKRALLNRFSSAAFCLSNFKRSFSMAFRFNCVVVACHGYGFASVNDALTFSFVFELGIVLLDLLEQSGPTSAINLV